MGIANSAKNRLGIAGELFRFFWRIGRGWLCADHHLLNLVWTA